MKDLEVYFKATLVRYNFGDPFKQHTKTYDHYPSEEELKEFLEECNKDDYHKDFATTITVDKVFQVVNK